MSPHVARSAASELHRLEALEARLRAQATDTIVQLGQVREQILRLRLSLSAEELRQYETLAVVSELDQRSAVRAGR